jgi:hypothetical protein
MRRSYSYRPRLERLEERATPATIQVAAGNLIIRNPVGALGVTHLGGGAFQVADGVTNVVVGGVGSSVNIFGTNAAELIVFNANNPFGGRLLINAANGSDAIVTVGTVGGNAVVLPGLGNDVHTAANFNVGGNLTLADTGGINTFQMTGNVSVGGSFSATGYSAFRLNSSKLSVGNALTVSSPLSALGLTFQGNAAANLEVGGNWTVRGFAGADKINLAGTVNVNGNTFWMLGDGANKVTVNPGVDSTLAGNLYLKTGVGNDTVALDGLLTIGGEATVDLDFGTNELKFGVAGNVQANGNWRINVGNGNANNLLLDAAATFSGNVTINQGNGNGNTSTLNQAPAGTLTFRGGNGVGTTLTLNAGEVTINARFGNSFAPGSNLLNLSGGLTALRGLVQGSNFAGANLLNQGLALLEDIRLVGFPS